MDLTNAQQTKWIAGNFNRDVLRKRAEHKLPRLLCPVNRLSRDGKNYTFAGFCAYFENIVHIPLYIAYLHIIRIILDFDAFSDHFLHFAFPTRDFKNKNGTNELIAYTIRGKTLDCEKIILYLKCVN